MPRFVCQNVHYLRPWHDLFLVPYMLLIVLAAFHEMMVDQHLVTLFNWSQFAKRMFNVAKCYLI